MNERIVNRVTSLHRPRRQPRPPMSDSYYSDEALRKQADLNRKHAAGEPIDLADMRGIFQARDPRATAYGSCPTQLAGVTAGGDRFYFRARHGEWRLEVDGKVVASGDDDTGGYMHADVVDAIVSRELGDTTAGGCLE